MNSKVSKHTDGLKVTVADVISVMERFAPIALAENWDNCGLQVGSTRSTVRKIWVALDPLSSVVGDAAGSGVDLIITHHPLLFRPLKVIDLDTSLGRLIANALKAGIAIYSAHTNLDCANNGTNDILARKIGMMELLPWLKPTDTLGASDLSEAMRENIGMGRIGKIGAPVPLSELAKIVKSKLDLKTVKIAGNPEMPVQKVALCSGAGSSLLSDFIDTDADVFISGDFRYHDARDAEEAQRALIDIGHFASEHIMIDPLVDHLRRAAEEAGWSVVVEAYRSEQDPFGYI